MCETAAFVVLRGSGEFFDTEDPRGRLAAKALVIDLTTALQAAPRWQARNPVLWTQLTRTRDHSAHFYLDFDYDILWGVMVNRIPNLRQTLGDL